MPLTAVLGLAIIASMALVAPAPQQAEAHTQSYGHWHIAGSPGWQAYCGMFITEPDWPGTPNCYWYAENTKVCEWQGGSVYYWKLQIRVKYPNGSWYYNYANLGNCVP